MSLPGYNNSSIIPQSPAEGSAWEVNVGFTPGIGSMKGAEGIADAQEFLYRIAQQYGYGVEFDPDTYGGLGEPGGPEMQGQEMGTPVTIVQRNEAGEQIGIIPGVRIGYGENSRVVTLDELARINEIRRRSGQSTISTGTPGFVPEFVDESGAPVNNETVTNTTPVLLDQETGGGGAPRRTTSTAVDGSTSTSGSIYNTEGSGGGMRPIRTPAGIIYVPEGLNPLQLLTQGLITREIYKQQTGEDAPDIAQTNQVAEPVELKQETGDPLRIETMTDAERNGKEDDPNFTGEFNGQQYENGMLVSSGDTTQTSLSTATGGISDASSTSEIGDTTLTGGDTTVSTGATTLTGGDSTLTGGDLYGGDVSTGDTSLTTGATTLTGGAVTTGPVTTDVTTAGGAGGAGGSVNISFGDGTGGQGITPEQALDFFTQLSTIPAFQTGEALEGGAVPGIYPTAIGSVPQATSFIQSMLGLDRAVSPQQAETALDLYRQITGGVREAQSPLMQSLARRAEMQGVEAERLMGPLSFLEERGATQAGYGQAAALGRSIDPLLREQQAGRLREEQRNVNLQLAGNLLGQQRATAGLMADIESGIYGRMAPDIGVDPGQILGIAGTDIQNILGEQAARQYSDAIREQSRREQQGQLLETGIGLIPKDFITFGGAEKEGGFTIPGTSITVGGTTI